MFNKAQLKDLYKTMSTEQLHRTEDQLLDQVHMIREELDRRSKRK